MPQRPCLGCGAITTGSRCPACKAGKERARDQQRGSRQDRGYDTGYDQVHRDYQRRMDQGETFPCWSCALDGNPHPVDPTPGRWHLGHDPHDRSIIKGPQCPTSNLRAATRLRVDRRKNLDSL